jgi:hypothetical protein
MGRFINLLGLSCCPICFVLIVLLLRYILEPALVQLATSENYAKKLDGLFETDVKAPAFIAYR